MFQIQQERLDKLPKSMYIYVKAKENINNFWLEKCKSADWNQSKQIMAYHA